MILMPMSDHKTFYFINILLQISHVRYHQVDSQHIVLRECQTAVHNNYTVFKFEGSYIHSDLFQAAQRNDTQF